MAVVLERAGSVAVVTDWPEPECGPDEVRIAVRGVGLCGSDLAVVAGKRPVPALPWVLGHEAVGDIIEVGARVTDRRVGQRVVVEPNFPCLACPACLAGATASCAHRRILGISEPGGLVERLSVPSRFAWPVPADWSDADLVCVEPLAVARNAVARSGARPGMPCLVVGAGAQGLLVCLALLALGAIPYVTDPHPARLELASTVGARKLAEVAEDSLFPVVIETSGAPEALVSAVSRAAPDGCVALIGFSTEPAALATFPIVQRRLTLRGCLIYDHPDDFSATIGALAALPTRPSQLVRARFPIADAARAFREAAQVAGKSWIALPQADLPQADLPQADLPRAEFTHVEESAR